LQRHWQQGVFPYQAEGRKNEKTIAFARKAPKGEIKLYEAGHFDFYLGEAFEQLVADQTQFLSKHLLK
jgi:hypothetical protein